MSFWYVKISQVPQIFLIILPILKFFSSFLMETQLWNFSRMKMEEWRFWGWTHNRFIIWKMSGVLPLWVCVCVSCSVVSDSMGPHGLWPTRLFRPWDVPGQNTRVGCHSFSSGSSWLRDWTQISCIAGRCFTIWATREAPAIVYLFFTEELIILGSCQQWAHGRRADSRW